MSESFVITKIEKQKNRKRYNLYLNDEYFASIDENVLISLRLLKGKEIDKDTLNEIITKEDQSKAWNSSLRYLSYRNRSEAEIIKYLTRKDYTKEIIDLVLKRLKDNNYINDSQYAISMVNHRISSKPMGKILLSYELRNKGLSELDIEEALKCIDNEIEYSMAIKLADKKINDYKLLDWDCFKNKMGNYLQRKGFSYSLILKVLHSYRNNFDGEN